MTISQRLFKILNKDDICFPHEPGMPLLTAIDSHLLLRAFHLQPCFIARSHIASPSLAPES